MAEPPRVAGKQAALPRGVLWSHWSHPLAFGLGSGLSPVAPGTAGTLLAWALHALAAPWLSPVAAWAIIIGGFVAGRWICQQVVDELGVQDHSAIVWDEIIAFWLVLQLAQADWLAQLALFGGFRFFDAVKPPPIGWLDRRIKGGWGVMIDDLAAALATLACLFAWRAL
ncbi:MAG: phosphatidylglycerophosphatase A [Burkholderiaceae bacterium]